MLKQDGVERRKEQGASLELDLAKASRSRPDGEHNVSSCDNTKDLDGDVPAESGESFQRRSWSQFANTREGQERVSMQAAAQRP